MIRLCAIAALCSVAAYAAAEDISSGTDFTNVQLDRAGIIKGNYKTGRIIETMSGGVEMTFLGKTSAENVKLSANRVEFEYANEGARKPSRITMSGGVIIVVEGNRVESGAADFDLDADLATFTENPVIDMKDGDRQIKLAASIILLNLDTGDFEVRDGQRVHEESD